MHRRLRMISLGISAVGGIFASLGCASTTSEIHAGAAAGHVVLLPGIEGGAWQLRGVTDGLRDAGIRWTVEIIPWGTPPLHSLDNLTNLSANLDRARRIASRLAELRQASPKDPLVLVGYSGGGGLAILTLNAVSPDVKVDRVILVAAAISNSYDLTTAFRQSLDKVINVYSPRDGIVGWGTSVLGTIDRIKTISAGYSGFINADGSPRIDPKLVQVGWSSEWETFGHFGSHIGYLYRAWACHILAPLVDPALTGVGKLSGDQNSGASLSSASTPASH